MWMTSSKVKFRSSTIVNERECVKRRSESSKRYDVANLIVDFVLIYSNFVLFSFAFLTINSIMCLTFIIIINIIICLF